jgi:Bacterial membrane protein YfhO
MPTTSAAADSTRGDAAVIDRKGILWAAAVYAVVMLVFAYPALSGGFLVSGTSDQYLGGYAVRSLGAAYWAATGHVPQWNPYFFGGMPFIGSVSGDSLYPVAILFRLILRPDMAVTWLFVVHDFLAGLFAYVFLRTMGFSFFGALIAGLAYMIGGPIASYVSPGHDGKLYVSALFPLICWAIVHAVRDGRAWAWPVLSLLVGLGILTPHVQIMQYTLVAAFIVGLYFTFWAPETRDVERAVLLRRLGLAMGAMVLGLAIGAIQFAPVLEYVKFSPRAGAGHIAGGGYGFASSYSFPPEELFGTYLPEFFGILDNYWGRTGIHYQSDYLGAVVLVLVGAAFFSARRAQLWFWVSLGAFTLLWALGSYTPFFHLIYVLVPGTKFFRAPAAVFFVTALAVAALAGQGVDAAFDRRVRPWYLISCAVGAVLIAVLAAAGGLTNVAESLAGPERFEAVLANTPAVTFGAVRAMIVVLLTVGLIAAVVRGRLGMKAAAWSLVVLMAADLWSVEHLYWKWSPPASITYASDAAIDYLRKQTEPGRVLGLPTGRGSVPHDAELEADGLMIHQIRQVLGYSGNELYRYDQLTGRDEGYRATFTQPNVWSLLNIRFLLTDLDSLPIPGAQKVVGPITDAAGSKINLYRLPGDNPAAWVVPVAVKAPDDQTLATVRDPRFPPLQAAIFDTSAKVPVAANLTALPAPLGLTANVTRYDPGHITVQLSTPAPAGATLIVSENHYPGWSATVDGKPAVAARADYTLIGVPLAAGSRTIDLVFHDPAFPIGVWMTALGTLGALLWWAVAVWFQRTRVVDARPA